MTPTAKKTAKKTTETKPTKKPAAKKATAKEAAPKKAAKVEKTTEAKPAEAKPAQAKRVTVSSVARDLILAGKSNEEVWAVIKSQFDLDDGKKHYPSWYRSDLRRRGILPAA